MGVGRRAYHFRMAAISPTGQRNGVSEGIAFGLLMLQQYEFPFPKMRLDFAFERSWRNWPDRYRSQFGQVNTDLLNGLGGSLVMTHATERKQTFAFFWDRDYPPTIYARQQDWDSDDPNDVEFAVSVISGEIPIEGWVSLARDFVADLGS